MKREYTAEEQKVADKLNWFYAKGAANAKAYMREYLSHKNAKEMTFQEMCDLRDELMRIQGAEEIGKIDEKLDQVDKKMEELKEMREKLFSERHDKFRKCKSDIGYEIYEGPFLFSVDYKCRIFLHTGEKKEILFDDSITRDEPFWEIDKCPEDYKTDFIMLWHQAQKEIEERKLQDEARKAEEAARKRAEDEERIRRFWERHSRSNNYSSLFSDKPDVTTIPDDIRKKFYRVLARIYHPDAVGKEVKLHNDDPDIIKYVYQLKDVLQIV